jgi:hypothetical protein
MNWKIWYNLPNKKSFAFIGRSGTSSLGLMSLKTFYPDRLKFAPENIHCGMAHRLNDHEMGKKLPDGCLVMVRNPIERFISLLNRFNVSVDRAINLMYWFYDLGNKPKKTDRSEIEHYASIEIYHFAPLVYFLKNAKLVNLIPFPDFQKAAEYLDLNYNHEHINISEKKIELTSEQKNIIKIIYNEDFKIWKNIKEII